MQEKIFKDFIGAFNELKGQIERGEVPEGEMFKLSKQFFMETGGKLSQYNSPLAVGVAVVPVKKDGEIGFLAFKRGINPFIGGVAFPGGFVDEMESSKEAAIRELKEETGLVLDEGLEWTHIGEKKTPANQLLIFYTVNTVVDWEDVVKAYENHSDKSESQGLVFLESETDMCFSLHAEIRDEQFKSIDPLEKVMKKSHKI